MGVLKSLSILGLCGALVRGEFATLKELRTQLESDLSAHNAELLDLYNKAPEGSCDSGFCSSVNQEEPVFEDIVEEQFPPVYYEKLEIAETRPFGVWPSAGTTEWDLIRQGKLSDTTRRRLQETSTVSPDSTTTSTVGTDGSTTVPDDEVTVTGGEDNSTTTVPSNGTDSTASTTSTSTVPGNETSTTTIGPSEDSVLLNIHWQKVGGSTVHKILPTAHELFPTASRKKLRCARTAFEAYATKAMRPESRNGQEEVWSDAVGFYRFVGIDADTMLYYPMIDDPEKCEWESPVQQGFIPRTTLGNQRILIRIINGYEMWAPFGLSDLTAFYDYASTDLSRQNTKMLLQFIDNLTMEDELALTFFEPTEVIEDVDFLEFAHPNSTWSVYPVQEPGQKKFLKMTKDNKSYLKQKVIDYHHLFVEEYGFKERNFLKTLQRNQTALFVESMEDSISWFETEEQLHGPVCHHLMLQVDTLNDSVTRLRGGSQTGQASVDVDLVPTVSQMRKITWLLSAHRIVFSRIQTTYIDVHTSDPSIFRFEAQKYLAAHRSERMMEAPTAGDVDNYGLNPHSAVLLKPPTIYSCMSGGISLCSPYNVLWDYAPYHLNDAAALYVHQNSTVYVTVDDKFTNNTSTMMGCQVVYRSSGDPLGVGCLDLKLYAHMSQIEDMSDYTTEIVDMQKNGLGGACPHVKPLEEGMFSDFSAFQTYITTNTNKFNKRSTECQMLKSAYTPNGLEHKVWDERENGTFPLTSSAQRIRVILSLLLVCLLSTLLLHT